MLRTTNLTYRYPNGPELHFPDLECADGSHWLMIGASGSGKTTYLQLLGGLRRPHGGQIELRDTVLNQLSNAALDRFRGQHIGIVFQQPHFVRSLSVEENLLLAQKLSGRSTDRKHANALLDRLQLADKHQSRPWELSVGEQQRAAIALALVNQPSLILADEPTSALDDYNADRVLQLLQEQAASVNAILLIITHDIRLKERISNFVELAHPAHNSLL